MTEVRKKYMTRQMAMALPVMRKALNLKQTDVCERTGVSRSILSAVEKGARALSWDTFLTLLSIFYVNERSRKMLSIYDIDLEELSAYLTAS